MTAPSDHPPDIPDKLYFRIGEVSRISGLPSSVLRFWESEFPRIKPKRTEAGQRLYRRSDVELILTIKHLLYDKKFTIKGARQYLRNAAPPEEAPSSKSDLIQELLAELKTIRELLE
ncbi:MAG: MerR family transcriptional regulator [Desulfobacteraceae bacterium]|nr:MAG: MerR family transcriptional regulator [Desulfobacteraceae bacterium]